MTTGAIPDWNAQGVLPPFAVRAIDRRKEQRLLAERSVLRSLVDEISVAESQRAKFLQERLDKIERQLAAERSNAGVDGAKTTDELSVELRTIVGRFQGVLPTCGEFEFLPQDGTTPIHGYLSLSITAAARLNEHLHRRARIRVLTTRAAGGPECFRLLDVAEWLDKERGISTTQEPTGNP